MKTVNPTPGLFCHVPRQPELGHGEYSNQRRFGGHVAVEQQERTHNGTGARLTVYRHATCATGELMVAHANGCVEVATTTIAMSADEMQALACALLDAAHDLRTRPAAITPAGGDHESQKA